MHLNVKRFMEFVDAHPRTGWYVAAVVTLNFLLNLVDFIH